MTHTITLTEGQYEGTYEKVDGEPRIGDLIRFSQHEDAVYYVRSLNTEETGDDENLIIVSCPEVSELEGATAFAFYPFEQEEVFRKVGVEPRPGQLIQVTSAEPRPCDKPYKDGDIFEVGYTWGYEEGCLYPGITTTQNLDLWDREFEVLAEVQPLATENTEATEFEQRLNEIATDLVDLLARKNRDYGDSFGKQFDEYGITSALVRMDDKMNRLKSLREKEQTEVAESLEDTLIDLAGYALMTVDQLRSKR